MASVNKAIILGNLGRDPEVKYTPSNLAICTISIATTRKGKNKDSGEKTEETEWHNVVFFDKLAEIAGQYLKKGRPVYVEGRLRTRKWQDKEGNDRYSTEIVAEQMQMLGGRDEGGSGERQERPASAPAPAQRQAARPSSGGFDDMDDDIPFVSADFGHDALMPLDKRMARYHYR
jgi:single-strand DNA-binding protein